MSAPQQTQAQRGQSKTVEQLQAEFIEAVKTLQQIHNDLTTAQWLREYEQADSSIERKAKHAA